MSHQQSFSYVGTCLPGFTSTKLGLMCFAREHNALTPVRLEPAALRSRVKLSTAKTQRSLSFFVISMKMNTLIRCRRRRMFVIFCHFNENEYTDQM